MSSSSEAVTAPGFARELRTGTWTRLGDRLGHRQILGDSVTEDLLGQLVEETRAAARAQGYATGWAEGRRAAEEQASTQRAELDAAARDEQARREAEHRSAVENLLRAAAALEQSTAEVAARVESHAVEVALGLTEELLGHELRVAESPGPDAVRRALALVPGEPVVRVRVCPEEAEGFDRLNQRSGELNQRSGELDQREGGLDQRSGELDRLVGQGAHVVPDPALRRGEVVVETDESVVDARVWGALDRVREVLRG